jgi:hydroxymethylbilane synthase
MRRMGWVAKVSQFIPVEVMLPAVGQGVLGIETRRNDVCALDAIAFLHDPVTSFEVGAERAFLQRLGGGCQLPIAGYAKKNGGEIAMAGLVGSVDGQVMIRHEVKGPAENFALLGRELADYILAQGGRALLDAVYQGGK